MTKVLMAMSGGIDSGVAAMLLRKQGYDIVGATFRNFQLDPSYCAVDEAVKQAPDAMDEARKLADQLGIEHHEVDACKMFHDTVVQNFIHEYLQGRTPNPCVLCNSVLKWGLMMQVADDLHCTHIATGHYARIGQQDGRYFVQCGADVLKDQSYFLWKLTSEQLQRTIFPLGDLTKVQVRQLADENGFQRLNAKKESEEICFIPDNDYRHFLEVNVPDLKKLHPKGNFVSPDGKVLGKHQGLYHYTIGQRKGLGIALGEPAYVVSLHPENNQVVLGRREDLECHEIRVGEANMQKYADFEDGMSFSCKIRYKSKAVTARLYHDDELIKVVFEDPVFGIAPGQSAVFYEGEDLVGGGVILKPEM